MNIESITQAFLAFMNTRLKKISSIVDQTRETRVPHMDSQSYCLLNMVCDFMMLIRK